MPFTLSHAAAAIPFRRTRLIMSAIVTGCFVPDFPHFLLLSRHVAFSHTIVGMFVLDLPLAIVALWIFHAFIKQPMLMFFPSGVRRRLTTSVDTFGFWPPERLSLIVLSILTGTTTHLLWDAFTHDNSWICQNWAFLRRWVDLPVTGGMPMYTLLEYASSVFGLALVAVWIWHWYRVSTPSAALVTQPMDAAHRRAFVAALTVPAALGGALRSWLINGIHLQIRPIVHFTADMLVSAITLFLLGLLVCGVILRRNTSVSSCSPV
ncbi:MAG TPA: DUF4184 family protein [Acidobacteriaceae bacterium]|nr:DUF4184 family protein [Acidobacteriaceae bacterium]